MIKRIASVTALALTLALTFSVDADAGRRVRTAGGKKQTSSSEAEPNGKDKTKPFSKMIKDKVAVEGLFTFYQDTTDNTWLMAIAPEHFGPIYLCGMARGRADGTYYDTGPTGRTFPFYFKRVGKNILMLEKNLRVRADSGSTMVGAVANGLSDHLFGSVPIMSKPADSTDEVLIDPSLLFVRDAESSTYYLQRAKLGISFDKKNSYFEAVKSFPGNTEIDVKLHFRSSRPGSSASLQNRQSFYHTYHFSLSSIPETDYVPRLADDRIGYFQTIYQDYTDLNSESAYVRYIQRWNLKKKNPDARVSEPVEPIVYWIENTVPTEYRDAIAEGIEFWNQSFAKIGYRNAVIAKQMPDTADWDPLDARYSTIRWMVSPAVYAIGPSRANPFTGQIYDADISIAADFIRHMFIRAENYIEPLSFNGGSSEEQAVFNPQVEENDHACHFAEELAQEAAFGMAVMMTNSGDFEGKSELTKEYVHSYIVELVAHEVGHTLGFRHNFKASIIHSLDEISDRNFTRANSTVGTVMEYAPPNIASIGETQGEFYASTPGAYDDWVVQYGYEDFGAENPLDEVDDLEAIATRSAEPQLAYATDHDVSSNTGVDPYVNTFDLGNDPLSYSESRIALTKELWTNALSKFEKPGVSYEKIRRVFQTGWRSYREATIFAVKFIGGLHHTKSHIGDAGGGLPYTSVAASEQRRAIKFLGDYIFAADAFEIDPETLNKLQSNQSGTYSRGLWGSPRAYLWHEQVLSVQKNALNGLYSRATVGRLLNAQVRYSKGAEKYTMYDMFTEVRQSIWTEVTSTESVNSYRRQLQMAHLSWITAIYLSRTSSYPADARSLAAGDLDVLEGAVGTALRSGSLDEMTKVHYKDVLRQINAAQNANRDFARR